MRRHGLRHELVRVMAGAMPLAFAAFAQAQPVAVGAGERPSLAPLLAEVTPAVVNISVMAQRPISQNPLAQRSILSAVLRGPGRRAARVRAESKRGLGRDRGRGSWLRAHEPSRDSRRRRDHRHARPIGAA